MKTSSVIEQVRSFSFARKHWNKAGDMIECPPGTWDEPYKGSPPDWCALLCCPACKVPAAISSLIHKVDYKGKLNKEWTCPKCKLTLNALLNSWGKEILFGIAYELNGKEAKMIYKHGKDIHAVRREFKLAYNSPNIRLVAIGQVLGYYNDESKKDDKIIFAD